MADVRMFAFGPLGRNVVVIGGTEILLSVDASIDTVPVRDTIRSPFYLTPCTSAIATFPVSLPHEPLPATLIVSVLSDSGFVLGSILPDTIILHSWDTSVSVRIHGSLHERS